MLLLNKAPYVQLGVTGTRGLYCYVAPVMQCLR